MKFILLAVCVNFFFGKSAAAGTVEASTAPYARHHDSRSQPDGSREVSSLKESYHVLVGVTSSAGNSSRFGPEIGIGHLVCGREGLCIEGPAVMMGAIGPGSYFAGFGGGLVFFPAVMWVEAAVRFRDQQTMGYHVMVAAGSLVMPYVSGVYDKMRQRTNLELGVTAKYMWFTW